MVLSGDAGANVGFGVVVVDINERALCSKRSVIKYIGGDGTVLFLYMNGDQEREVAYGNQLEGLFALSRSSVLEFYAFVCAYRVSEWFCGGCSVVHWGISSRMVSC